MQEQLSLYFQVASWMLPSRLPFPKFTDLPKIQCPQKQMVYWPRLNDVMLRHCIGINNAAAEVHKMTHGFFFFFCL